MHRRVPPAALIAAVTILGTTGVLAATGLVLPHILWASWSLLPTRAAEAAGLVWAMLVGGGAALTAAQLSRKRAAANDNALSLALAPVRLRSEDRDADQSSRPR